MIDLHCHVLPGVDDGPATVEAAIALARGAEEDGISTVVATPHVDWSHPELDSARIRSEVSALQARLDVAGVGITILPGAELAGGRAMELDDAELRRFTLCEAGCLLLECPLTSTLIPFFTGIARTLAHRGYRVLLAHPERCPIFHRSPEDLDELVGEGMLAQVTAGALTGQYGRAVRDLAFDLVDRGSVHVVASDGHGGHRPSRIAAELAQARIDPSLALWLGRDVPAAILKGAELPARPDTPPRRHRRPFRRLVGRR
jgi:protein-tyrosine phosphatase